MTRIMNSLKRSIAFTLFAVSLLSYSYFYQGGGQNEAARFDLIRSFLDEQRLIIDTFTANSADVIVVNSHVYSGKAPGTFYLGVVPYWLTTSSLNLFSVEADIRDHVGCLVATIFAVSLPAALTLVLLYWLGLGFGATRRDSAAGALVIGLATIIFPFATIFFSHVTAAFCLLLAFYQIFSYRQNHDLVSLPDRNDGTLESWRFMVAGISLGFSINLEYPSAIGVVWLTLYGLISLRSGERLRLFGTLLVGIFIGLIPLFVYNWYAFHNPFYVTYEAYAHSATTQFTAHKQGILGIRLPFLDPSAWPQFWSNFVEISVKPLRGLFFANPVLLLALVGYASVFRLKRFWHINYRDEFFVSLLMLMSYFGLNASFGDSITYWGGGASFGPRYLIVMIPFLMLPLMKSLEYAWVRAAFVPLALVSAFQCLMATAIEPRTPYSPPNPIYFFYFPRYLTGVLSINQIGIFSNRQLTINSVAFNWGKLWNFPPNLQLAPLFAIWLIAAYALDRQLQIKSRGFLFATGIYVMIAAGIPLCALAFA